MVDDDGTVAAAAPALRTTPARHMATRRSSAGGAGSGGSGGSDSADAPHDTSSGSAGTTARLPWESKRARKRRKQKGKTLVALSKMTLAAAAALQQQQAALESTRPDAAAKLTEPENRLTTAGNAARQRHAALQRQEEEAVAAAAAHAAAASTAAAHATAHAAGAAAASHGSAGVTTRAAAAAAAHADATMVAPADDVATAAPHGSAGVMTRSAAAAAAAHSTPTPLAMTASEPVAAAAAPTVQTRRMSAAAATALSSSTTSAAHADVRTLLQEAAEAAVRHQGRNIPHTLELYVKRAKAAMRTLERLGRQAERLKRIFGFASHDPGVDQAWPFFAADGGFLFITGNHLPLVLAKYHQQVRAMERELADPHLSHDRRRALHMALARLRTHIHGVVRNIQNVTIAFVSRVFKVIVAPRLNTAQLLHRFGKTMTKRQKTNLLATEQSRFSRRLREMVRLQHGVQMILNNEAWSSMRCVRCTKLNNNLGANPQFACPHCGLEGGRNELGSQMIGMMAIEEAPVKHNPLLPSAPKRGSVPVSALKKVPK